MRTQRLDLPCSFPPISQSPVYIQPYPPVLSLPIVEKTVESSCSLKQAIRAPPSSATALWEIKQDHHQQFWREEEEEDKKGKRVKRLPRKRRLLIDECCIEERVKRKRDDSTESHQGFAVSQVPPSPFFLTCSGGDGEEESRRRSSRRVYLMPCGEEVLPCSLPPLLNNTWVGSVLTEITKFNEKDDEETNPGSTGSSSSSSESHNYGANENPATPAALVHEHSNRSSRRRFNPGSSQVSAHNGNGDHEKEEERRGFELVSLLIGCIDAISSRNFGAVSHYSARLGDLASPRGRSPIARLVAYFTEALALRVTRIWPHMFQITLPRELERADDDIADSFRLLNQVSPILRFVHFTANEMLLRAFEGKDRIHIIDFDIKQGLQWPAFFQSLATQENPPHHVRITGIGQSKQDLIETGEQLHSFAETFNLAFEFHSVVDRLEDVRLWMLHVKEGECVAVNCIFQLHKLLYDPNGGIFRDFMGLIMSTNPVALVMAEQESDHNETNLERRICNSLRHYAAVFDLINSSLPLDSTTRIKIEEMFGREIRNLVACEGRDRFERHETFQKWSRRLMEGNGAFRCMGVREREIVQAQLLLKMYDSEECNIEKKKGEEEECEGVTFKWLDQPLYTVSAWTPIGNATVSH